jgi:predicted component of type VI protein secretion system
MNYVLQVVRGRSASTTLKLADGVTSIGRHDNCLIRIKSSQVSRRHCEVIEVADKIAIRDLGSSNGTFVNGKKISGQQVLKHGDELTLGAVTLRVAKLGQPASPAPQGAPDVAPKATDTAVVDAIVDDEPEEFEMEFDEADREGELDAIPLADDEDTVLTTKPKASAKAVSPARTTSPSPEDKKSPAAKSGGGQEDEAIAQFLLDIKLEDEV